MSAHDSYRNVSLIPISISNASKNLHSIALFAQSSPFSVAAIELEGLKKWHYCAKSSLSVDSGTLTTPFVSDLHR